MQGKLGGQRKPGYVSLRYVSKALQFLLPSFLCTRLQRTFTASPIRLYIISPGTKSLAFYTSIPPSSMLSLRIPTSRLFYIHPYLPASAAPLEFHNGHVTTLIARLLKRITLCFIPQRLLPTVRLPKFSIINSISSHLNRTFRSSKPQYLTIVLLLRTSKRPNLHPPRLHAISEPIELHISMP